MMSALLSRCLILVLGTLYPAYRSYKAIKNKDLREHVKWMMYWIVFALFTTCETFLDIFFSWFPFYYEIKILFILWVLSPATRGSSLLYKKVVHPMLISREKEIDDLIEKTKQQGYSTFIQLFSSGFNYASNLFLSSALKGQMLLGNQLKKSLSLNDVYEEVNSSSSSGMINSGNSKHSNGSSSSSSAANRAPSIEEEYSDYEQENNRIRRQPSSRPNNRKLINKNSYEIIDDDILLTDDSNEPARKQTVVSTKKRSSSKNQQQQQQQMTNGSAQASSYKSNEASHFGTITRGKSSKNKTSTLVPSSSNNDNDN